MSFPSLEASTQSYKSFQILKYLPIEEIQSTLIELIHEPTGARILHIAAPDPENLFCLSFQTFPSSSNGVAHVLEHTILCGSEKFPVKDPFFSMARRSLNTYLNALTSQDFTCYPASSQLEKDFYNLLEVYLDAAFHPRLRKVSFLQEGHRLEFTDPKNGKSPLRFQGVVYNEMKGAMSSRESRLWKALFKHLTPDLPYAHNSGGDPQAILSLTYEELLEFYKIFYHPSRCLFFFYGNIPLSKHLDFLEKELQRVEKIAPLPPLPPQKRFTAPVFATECFPITAEESLEKKGEIAFSWLTVPLAHQEEVLALSLLESLLMDTDASLLKKRLLKSGLCTEADSAIDVEMSEVPFTIICKGCEPNQGEALRNFLFTALREIASSPFAPEEIEASLHQLEFQRTEIRAEGIPFGLTLFFRAALIKQHGSEAENGLLIHSLFRDLRARLADPFYLPSLIQKYLIDNPHFVQLTLSPDVELQKREEEEEEKRLAAIRAHLSEAEEKNLLAQAEELATYQETIETQSLHCLPKIQAADIPPHPPDFPLIESVVGDLLVFHHNCFTNQILYVDLVFDLPDLPASDLPLLSLFTRFLTEVGCGGRDYAANLAYQQAYVGETAASLSLHVTHQDPDICYPALSLRGKALARNGEKLLSLFADFIESVDFSDEARLSELFAQHFTSLENQLIKNALNYAVQTALSGFSTASFIFDQWNGLSYYQSVLRWAKQSKKEWISALQRLQKEVLGRGKPHLVLSGDEATIKGLDLHRFAKRLAERPISPWRGSYSLPNVKPQVRFIASPVAFTAHGFRTIAYRENEAPYLLLVTELLENCYLHKEIREKGGAYGSGASYAPSTGNFYLFSFRDPHLAQTVSHFHKAFEKIAQGNFNDRELEEAKLGVFQTLDAPVPPGARGITAYSWKRAGRTLEHRRAFRKNILKATKKEIVAAVERFLLPSRGISISFLGKELFEKEKKKLKEPLSVLPL